MRIVFMGTPDFSVPTLEALIASEHDVVAVVTQPDKKSGRGQKLTAPPVKRCAEAHNIPVLQPEKMKDPEFIEALRNFEADIQVVVAFRMLPEMVWDMPPKGTFNVHTSLLPEYRGAAPINWAVMNGETESGLTTFLLDHQIDTGKILFQEKVSISPTMTAGELHDELMNLSGPLALKTLEAIESGDYKAIPQDLSIDYKHAPKIFKEDMLVPLKQPLQVAYNHIRGLSPYPGAHIEVLQEGETIAVKILSCHIEPNAQMGKTYSLGVYGKKLGLQHPDGMLWIETLKWPGKRLLKTSEFLNGFKFSEFLDVKA
ncbi:MAG: methionyl-tRNA formyltransferase [Schleiferiaceae bacterium]